MVYVLAVCVGNIADGFTIGKFGIVTIFSVVRGLTVEVLTGTGCVSVVVGIVVVVSSDAKWFTEKMVYFKKIVSNDKLDKTYQKHKYSYSPSNMF